MFEFLQLNVFLSSKTNYFERRQSEPFRRVTISKEDLPDKFKSNAFDPVGSFRFPVHIKFLFVFSGLEKNNWNILAVNIPSIFYYSVREYISPNNQPSFETL